MINEGSIIGNRYKIICEIGRGGMAKVYKAYDTRLNRNVAIKILNEDYSLDKKFVREFIQEARAAAGIFHQNIVNVFDAGEEDNLHYIVMELVEGITLKKYIEKVGKVSSEDTCKIAIQIAYGIEAAHNKNIIHRDIKPQNIVMSEDGYAKVADFGIAKAANGATINNAVAGSVHYMAPEQARTGFSDEKSDIYSLGITMYEMVTGRLPFDSGNNVSVVLSHISSPIVPPSQYVSIYPGLEQIILKATSKRADNRYKSISEMLKDLKFIFKNPDKSIYNDYYDDINNTRYFSHSDSQYNSYDDEDYYDDHHYDNYYYEDDYYGDEDEYYLEDKEDSSSGEVVNPKIKKLMNVLTIIGGAIITLLLVFLIAKIGFSSKSSDVDKVPKILGLTLKEATKIAETAKFKIEVVGFDNKAPEEEKDSIKSQEPKPGEKWDDKNKKLIKVIIAGSDQLRIPELEGRPKDQALKVLEELGILVSVQEIYDNDKENGIVVKTDPLGGSSIVPNDKITLYVSKGAETIKMPSLKGLSLSVAQEKLSSLGITFTVEEDNGPKDTIIKTNPSAGENFQKSKTVVLYVGNGKNAVEVPDLVGDTYKNAIRKLERLKLVIDAYSEESDTVKEGKVIRIEPEAGTSVAEGDTVKVIVSVGRKVQVPNVVGMEKDDAIQTLQAAGFNVRTRSGVSLKYERGLVIEQNPQADTYEDKDRVVTITINK